MATEVKLPELGEGVAEGELVKWLVKIGDTVKPDQPVVEVMTDKATVEVPTPTGGVVKELKFKVGDVIKVENVILTLDAGSVASATAGATAQPAAAATPAAQPAMKAPTSNNLPPAGATASVPGSMHAAVAANAGFYPPAADSKVLATPSTRRLAREMNVDINTMPGSGLAGRVTREDVMSARSGGGGGGLETYSNGGNNMRAPTARPAYQGQAGAARGAWA